MKEFELLSNIASPHELRSVISLKYKHELDKKICPCAPSSWSVNVNNANLVQ